MLSGYDLLHIFSLTKYGLEMVAAAGCWNALLPSVEEISLSAEEISNAFL